MPSFSFILLMISEKKNFEYIFENLPFMSPRQLIKSSDLDKSHMKHAGLINKYFCKKKSNIPNDLAEIVNFHFSHYKSMQTLSCHSNQSSYPTKIKKHNFCRRQCPKQVCLVSASSTIWFLRRRFLNIFTKIDPFCPPPPTTNQIHQFGQKLYET